MKLVINTTHELSSGAYMLEACFLQHQRDCQQQKAYAMDHAQFIAHPNLLETH